MNRLILTCTGMLFLSAWLSAQNVTRVTARQANDIVEITYDLDRTADVSVEVSTDGGKSFSATSYTFQGDIGSDVTAGRKTIRWKWTLDGIKKSIQSLCFKVIAKGRPSTDKITFEAKGVSFSLVKVAGGTFVMGATPEQGKEAEVNEKPKHKVTLIDYYIGETEVTQELWKAVYGNDIYDQMEMESRAIDINGIGDNYPMVYINTFDCLEFIDKLNSLLYSQLKGRRFALPTEAQWEYAARGGQKSLSYKYSGSNDVGRVAWYSQNATKSSQTVGTKDPNELGIYDMSGNVCEWCQDKYGEYKGSSQTEPKGPNEGNGYVYRGGSWDNDAKFQRVSCRLRDAGTRHYNIGMRLVLQ